jgi:hypothetical protein
MVAVGIGGAVAAGSMIAFAARPLHQGVDAENMRYAQGLLDEGRHTFRYDTFGSEAFWGDALQLHNAIVGQKNGGVGPGVSPKTALAVGLKVDADALPGALKKQLAAHKVDLDDPATTIALLKLNAVVGVTAFANRDGGVRSMGIQCALCHSTPTIRSPPASAGASTAGPTATSTSAPSCRWRPISSRSPTYSASMSTR